MAKISQGLCETTNTERFQSDDCICITYSDNLGPCIEHMEGHSGKCVYCDHMLSCYPTVYLD